MKRSLVTLSNPKWQCKSCYIYDHQYLQVKELCKMLGETKGKFATWLSKKKDATVKLVQDKQWNYISFDALQSFLPRYFQTSWSEREVQEFIADVKQQLAAAPTKKSRTRPPVEKQDAYVIDLVSLSSSSLSSASLDSNWLDDELVSPPDENTRQQDFEFPPVTEMQSSQPPSWWNAFIKQNQLRMICGPNEALDVPGLPDFAKM